MASRKQSANLRDEESNRDTVKSKPSSSIDSDVKGWQAAGILMMVFSVILFLALVSYHRSDWPNRGTLEQAQNLIGFIGAILAYYSMYAMGWSSLFFSPIIFFWGWRMLTSRNYEHAVEFSIYSVLTAIIVSTCFAFPESILKDTSFGYDWSGLVGMQISLYLIKYLGAIGAVLMLVTASVIILIFAIDLNVTQIAHSFRDFIARSKDWLFRLVESDEAEESELTTIVKASKGEKKAKGDEEEGEIEMIPPGPEIVRSDMIEEPAEIKLKEPGKDKKKVLPTPILEDLFKENEEVEFDIEGEVREEEVDYDSREIEEMDEKYQFPSVELLKTPIRRAEENISEAEIQQNSQTLVQKLADFGVEATVSKVAVGPVITLYEVQPAPGVKVSSIVSLSDDLALAMEAKGIRIIAPIPGKAAIGIEIPNRVPSMVYLKEIINSKKFTDEKSKLTLAFGKTISGEIYTQDLAKMPHLLIAGSTGSGKSVGINTVLASILYRARPSEVKFVMIDPKKLELSIYADLRNHHLATREDLGEDVITTPQNAVEILRSVVLEMERRYNLLAKIGVRNIEDYNEEMASRRLNGEEEPHRNLEYLVVVIDELADLMMTAAREVEEPITRIAQLARAVGIHLIIATQRPSVDVITGVIKANFPARIAYRVISKVDSRTILDMNGAEQLLGNGDMLFMPPGEAKPIRMQNAFVSTEEIKKIISHVKRQAKLPESYRLKLPVPSEQKGFNGEGSSGERDELFEEAKRLVIRHQQGSVSLLQRRLKIGYSRAARLIDQLEEAGIVGPFDGSKARDVLMTEEELETESTD